MHAQSPGSREDLSMIDLASPRLVPLALAAILGVGCATTNPAPRILIPAGVALSAPPVIRQAPTEPGISRAREVLPGDQVVEVDSTPVDSLQSLLTALSSQHFTTVTVRRNGKELTLPRAALVSPKTGLLRVSPLAPGDTIVVPSRTVYHGAQPAGLLSLGNMMGEVAATLLPGPQPFVEVFLTLNAPSACTSCAFKNLLLMDWGTKSWLPPVSQQTVANFLYPEQGQVPPPIPVPPPQVVGATAYSSTTGSVSAYNYGSYIEGTYNGTTTTTITPTYDYTARNMALGYNLGVALRQARVNADRKARMDFLLAREGNLSLGQMVPGQHMQGYVDFVVPRWAHGPFVVFVMGKGTDSRDSFAAIRFTVPPPAVPRGLSSF